MANRHQRRAEAAGAPRAEPHYEIVPPGTEVTMHATPSLYAASIQVAVVNNDYMLGFTRSMMGHALLNGETTPVAQVVPVADIMVSPMTLKDIYLVLEQVVAEHEKNGVQSKPLSLGRRL